MKQVVTEGIVLTRTNFGEADRILTILTIDQGKIRAIAKGVRKIKSKLAGGIELFSVSQITYIQSKSDIYTLISTRLKKHYNQIVGDLERTMFAYDVLKSINNITEDNVDRDYFDLLQLTLDAINTFKLGLNVIQFWFNMQLLGMAGHEPNLQFDSAGNKLNGESKYNFDINSMCFTENSKGKFGQQHIKLFRLGLNLNSPQTLSNITNIDNVLPSCLELSMTLLKHSTQ